MTASARGADAACSCSACPVAPLRVGTRQWRTLAVRGASHCQTRQVRRAKGRDGFALARRSQAEFGGPFSGDGAVPRQSVHPARLPARLGEERGCSTSSAPVSLLHRQPAREHRNKYAVPKHGVVVDRGECVQTGDPKDGVPQPGVNLRDP